MASKVIQKSRIKGRRHHAHLPGKCAHKEHNLTSGHSSHALKFSFLKFLSNAGRKLLRRKFNENVGLGARSTKHFRRAVHKTNKYGFLLTIINEMFWYAREPSLPPGLLYLLQNEKTGFEPSYREPNAEYNLISDMLQNHEYRSKSIFLVVSYKIFEKNNVQGLIVLRPL